MRKIAKVPVMLQMETCECGAASLGMILAYYGREIPLEQLRIDCGVSSEGSTVAMLKAAGERNGLAGRAFRMDAQSVRSVAVPAIIHWNMAHFVVLCGFDKKGAVIADPAYGRMRVTFEEFSQSFTGIVLTFEKGEQFQRENRHTGSDFIAVHMKRFLPVLTLTVFAGIIAACAQFFVPLFDTAFIDRILIGGKLRELPFLLCFLFVCALLTAAATAFGAKLQDDIERRMSLFINTDFMLKLCRLPIGFFVQRNPGELTDRQSGNLEIAENICKIVAAITVNLLISLCYLIGLCVFQIQIGIIGLVAAAANVAMIILLSKKQERSAGLYRRNSGILMGGVSSAVDMMETVKSCGCENAMFERLAGAGAKNYAVCGAMERLSAYSGAFFSLINQLVNALLLIVGIAQVISGNFTVGLLVALEGLFTAFLSPLGSVARLSVSLHTFKGNADAANDAMHYTADDTFLEEPERQTDEICGDIQAQGLSFQYGLYARPVLRDVSFTVTHGQSVAFVGGSGSGKSTLSKLAAGLYTPTDGTLHYSGSGKCRFSKEYFYSKVAIVDQNISLFSGTVMENITMFDRDISYEEAVEAAKLACIHEEILMRGNGHQTIVEENGKNFSGGQRQRIEIARALAKKPEILILDEATSALDAAVEAEIMENIRQKQITLIIVAHRLSTIRDCDEIIVLENGRICERGTHEELMRIEGKYQALIEGGER